MSETAHISEVTERNFDTEVIERSYHTTVFVDFWAEWCNPCKILIPVLSALAEKYAGKFHLAKVNSDKERNLSAKYGIRSIPSIKIFKQGEIIDDFNGALPESVIVEYIEKHQFNESDLLLQDAKQALESNHQEEAADLLNSILVKDTNNIKAIALLSRIELQRGNLDVVKELLGHVTINKIDNPEIQEIHILNDFAHEIVNTPDISTLQSQLETEDNLELRYQLACRFALLGNYEKALEQFYSIMAQSRQFKDDGARKSMLAIFELLGSAGPLVTNYRMKIARILH